MAEAPVLEVEDLARYFDVSRPWLQRVLAGEGRRTLKAVDGISFEVAAGKTLAVVGESGCGKSVTALAIMGLLPPAARLSGSIRLRGREMSTLLPEEWRGRRGRAPLLRCPGRPPRRSAR